MAIITLTTDYGNKDYSVSSLKAKLISNIDNIRIRKLYFTLCFSNFYTLYLFLLV